MRANPDTLTSVVRQLSNIAAGGAWHVITMDGTWTVPAGYAAPQYRLLNGNNLQLTGCANWGGSLTANKSLNASHPLAGIYVPTTTKLYRVAGSGGRGAVQIDTAGTITMICSASFPGQYCEIDGIIPLGV